MSLDQIGPSATSEKSETRPVAVSPSIWMAAAALIVVLPGIIYGYPTGHDTFLHATAWFDTLTHWQEGNFFPAWGARFAFGWGQPVHIFYPPLSFDLGTMCLLLFGAYFAPIAFAWLTLTAGGYTTYRFAKLLVAEKYAVVAGLTYLLSPYLGLNLYERNAFGEVMATAIFPLVLLAYVRMQRDKRSPLWLAFALCLMLLANIPAMAITASIVGLLTLVDAVRLRSARPIFRSALAAVTALCLSAFYLLPAIAQRTFVKLNLVATGGQAPVNNFELFGGHPPFHHQFFSYLALISVILTLLLVALLVISWSKHLPLRAYWIAISALSIFLMLPVSAGLYRLPGMKYINFPWRFLFVVSFLIAILLAYVASEIKMGVWMIAVTGVAFAISWLAMWPPTWLHNEEATWGRYSAARTAQLGGVRELIPISAAFEEDGRYGPPQLVSVESGHPCNVLQVVAWQSEHRSIRYDCPPDTTLVLKTLFYPGWRILANRRPAAAAFNEHGAFLVKVEGAGNLEMDFVRTQDRVTGALVSIVTLLLCVSYAAIRRYRTPISSQE